MWAAYIVSFLDGHRHRRINVRDEKGKRILRFGAVHPDRYDEAIQTIDKFAAMRGINLVFEFETRKWG